MIELTRPDPLWGDRLAAELDAAGVVLTGDLRVEGDRLIIPTDADRATVEQVVAAHTGEPPAEVVAEITVRTRVDQALDGLRQIRDSSGTLTAAQLSQAVRLLARVQIALVRLVLRKLDDTD